MRAEKKEVGGQARKSNMEEHFSLFYAGNETVWQIFFFSALMN
jgi:hypothetical protein